MINKKLVFATIAALVLVTGCSKKEGDDRSVGFVVENTYPNGMWDIVDLRTGFTSTNGTALITPNALLYFYDETHIPGCELDYDVFRGAEVGIATDDTLVRKYTGWKSGPEHEPNTRILMVPNEGGKLNITYQAGNGDIYGTVELKNRREYSEADLLALRARTCTPQYGWDFG